MPRLLSFSQERTALRQTFSDMMKSRAVALARSENVDNKNQIGYMAGKTCLRFGKRSDMCSNRHTGGPKDFDYYVFRPGKAL